MLGNKHWMPAHRCLFAVIWDDRRRKPHSDEVGRMMLNGFMPLPIMYCLSFSLKWNFVRKADFCRRKSVCSMVDMLLTPRPSVPTLSSCE